MKTLFKKTGLILLTLLILATQVDARSYGLRSTSSSSKSMGYTSGLIGAGAIGIGTAAMINNNLVGTNLNNTINNLNERNNQAYNQRIYDAELRKQLELESKKEYLTGKIWRSLDENLTNKLRREFEEVSDSDSTHLGKNNPAYLETNGLERDDVEKHLRLFGNFYSTVYTGKMPVNLFNGEYMRSLTEETKFVLKERVRLLNEKQLLLDKGEDTKSINLEIEEIERKIQISKKIQEKKLKKIREEEAQRLRELEIQKVKSDNIYFQETIDFLNKSQYNLDTLGIVYWFTVRHPKWMGDMEDFFNRNPGTKEIFNQNKKRFLSKEFQREAYRITFNRSMEMTEYKNPAFEMDKYRVRENQKIENQYKSKIREIENSRQNGLFKWWDKKMAELDYQKIKPLPHPNDGVKIRYEDKTCLKILAGHKTGRIGLTYGGFVMDGKDYYEIHFNDRFLVQRILKVGDRVEKVDMSQCAK